MNINFMDLKFDRFAKKPNFYYIRVMILLASILQVKYNFMPTLNFVIVVLKLVIICPVSYFCHLTFD